MTNNISYESTETPYLYITFRVQRPAAPGQRQFTLATPFGRARVNAETEEQDGVRFNTHYDILYHTKGTDTHIKVYGYIYIYDTI